MDILNEEVKKFISEPVIVEGKMNIVDAVKLMKTKNVTSLLIKSDDKLGIVTERDILYKAVGEERDLHSSIDSIATKPIITIDSKAKVREAIALMSKHSIRRLAVTEDSRVIGIITQMSIVGNITTHEEPLPMIDIPKGVICPYCQSRFDNKEALSKHIDKIHIGLGLLEGDLRKL